MQGKTRENILQVAKQLFNRNGFENTSARMIARTVGISQGNLRYHFATKNDIAEELFQRLTREYQNLLENSIADQNQVSINGLVSLYNQMYQLFFSYRFVLKDMTGLVRNVQGIEEHIRRNFEDRRTLFLKLYRELITNGYLKEFHSFELMKKIIYLQIFIGDFWMPHSQIYFGGDLQSEIRHYNAHWLTLLLPYMTDKAKQELRTSIHAKVCQVPEEFSGMINN